MKRICLFLLFFVPFLTSCNQKEKQCKETVKSFFNAIKNDNQDGMMSIYPDVEVLLSYYKSDSVVIKEVRKEADSVYAVEITNLYTNGFGKKFDRDMTLYLKPEGEKKMIIYDSKGMIGLSDSKQYAYAKRHGYIKEEHKTDVQISNAVSAAMILPIYDVKQTVQALADGNLVQGGPNWDKSFGSAHGNFIVKNTYNFRLHNLKYIVHFMASKDGGDITQDEGYVKIGDLMPGESTSASFFTSYVGNARWAKVSLHIDENDLFEAILEN